MLAFETHLSFVPSPPLNTSQSFVHSPSFVSSPSFDPHPSSVIIHFTFFITSPIDILKIIDYLSQLMYKSSILYRYVCYTTAGGPVYWRAGSYEMGQYTHCAGRKAGRAGSTLTDFADGAFLTNVSFYS